MHLPRVLLLPLRRVIPLPLAQERQPGESLCRLGFEIRIAHDLYRVFHRTEDRVEATYFERRDLRCRNFNVLIVFPRFVRLPFKIPIPSTGHPSVDL